MTKSTTPRFFIFVENFVTGEAYRMTKFTTVNVLEAIAKAQALNATRGDSTTYSVAKKPRGRMMNIVWTP